MLPWALTQLPLPITSGHFPLPIISLLPARGAQKRPSSLQGASPGHREGLFAWEIPHKAPDAEHGPLSSSSTLLLPLDQVLCPRHTQDRAQPGHSCSPALRPQRPPRIPQTTLRLMVTENCPSSPGSPARSPSSSRSHFCSWGAVLTFLLHPLESSQPSLGSITVPKIGPLDLAPLPTGGAPLPPQMAHWSLQPHSFPCLPSHYNTTILNWGLDSITAMLLNFFLILIF